MPPLRCGPRGRWSVRPLPTPSRPRRTDKDLLLAVANGSLEALGEFFERHEPALRRYLGRLGVASGNIDRLIHAAFIDAYQTVGQFDPANSAQHWLFRVATVTARRHRRSFRSLAARAAAWTHVTSSERTPGSTRYFERDHAARKLGMALERLSPRAREAFALVTLQRASAQEAACILDISLTAVLTCVHQARCELLAALEGRTMKASHCAHQWQAEATIDGRLSNDDTQSFRRHVEMCESCGLALDGLYELEYVAARLPVLASTRFERRRLRNELLRRANHLSLGPARARSWLRPTIIGDAFVCVSAFVLSVNSPLLRRPFSVRTTLPPMSTFQISVSPDTTWRTLEQSSTLRLFVERGRLELSVDQLQPGQRFLIDLPDGEIEVYDTRFIVNVESPRTIGLRLIDGPSPRRSENDGLPARGGHLSPTAAALSPASL